MKWYQLWVKNDECHLILALMKRIDPYLQQFGAVPKAPEGTPLVEPDGTIEVRSYIDPYFAKLCLDEYGFTIVKEQEND